MTTGRGNRFALDGRDPEVPRFVKARVPASDAAPLRERPRAGALEADAGATVNSWPDQARRRVFSGS